MFQLYLIQNRFFFKRRNDKKCVYKSQLRLCVCPILLELIFHDTLQFTTSTDKKQPLSFPVEELSTAFCKCLSQNVLNVLNETDRRTGQYEDLTAA